MPTSSKSRKPARKAAPAKRHAEPKRPAARRPRRQPAPDVVSPLQQATVELRTLADRMLNIGSAAFAAARGIGVATGAVGGDSGSPITNVIRRARAISEATESLRAFNPISGPPAIWGNTGVVLRQLREQAGLTLAEVGQAVNLKDPRLLAEAEKGLTGLPFEILLRLAAVLGRKDPISAAISLTRTSNPQLWEAFETLGFGKLVLQSAREREFVNVLRADDRARELDDDEFAELLAFVKATLDLAMVFKHREPPE